MAKSKKTDVVVTQDFIAAAEIEGGGVVQESLPGAIDPPEVVPPMSSLDWSDYVMSKFADTELDEMGNPKVEGLFRVAELLIGECVSAKGHLISPADCNNGWTASAEYTVKFLKTASYGQPLLVEFTGSADSSPRNTDAEFGRYPAAMAETRARGRALRTALRLRRVASEEISTMPMESDPEDLITDTQINALDIVCERTNVNVSLFIQAEAAGAGVEVKQISKMKRGFAADLLKKANQYQRGVPVPDGIRGFVKTWKKAN